MTISIKPTASGSTIEQDGSSILSIDASGNLTVPNNMTFSGTVTGISSYSDSDALSLFNASGSAPVYACRAWVNFNGTGTVAIDASGNVSSITDHGVGNYTINFTTALPDANYTVSMFGVAYASSNTAAGCAFGFYPTGTATYTPSAKTTTSARILSGYGGSAILHDLQDVSFTVFR